MSPQVRRIAILVTSLDSAAGRQLLLAMPSQLARDVRKAMASLTSVDPEEQRQVLAEFRKQAVSSSGTAVSTPAGARSNAAPESALSSALADQSGTSHAGQTNNTLDDDYSDASAGRSGENENARPWAQLDVTTLIDLLRGERALVIAVVLSQLAPRHAARLLEQFPREQHRTVLAHLATLGNIDPEAMQAIDEHLASRIADYHHRRDSQSESVGRMQELLAAASPELRGHWQDIIADSHHQLAKRLGIAAAPQPVASSASELHLQLAMRTSDQQPSAHPSVLDMLANNVVTTADAQVEPPKKQSSDVLPSDGEPVVLPFPTIAPAAATNNPASHPSQETPAITTLDQILELPPRTIARVLSAADGEVVLLALAGATPAFMQRFTVMLEKQDARVLQARLSKLGAINLQDIDEAQRRLCELASYIVAQTRARRPAASATRAAA